MLSHHRRVRQTVRAKQAKQGLRSEAEYWSARVAILPMVKVKVEVTLLNKSNHPNKPIKITNRSPTRDMPMRFVHSPSAIGCDTEQTVRISTAITPWVMIFLSHAQNRNVGQVIVNIPMRGIIINGKSSLSAIELLPRTITRRLQSMYSTFHKSEKEYGFISGTGKKAVHSITKEWFTLLAMKRHRITSTFNFVFTLARVSNPS